MRGLLGNFNHVVKPWWLPFDFVLIRIEDSGYHSKVTIARNPVVPNVYDTPVRVEGWKIVGLWEKTPPLPKLPDVPKMWIPPMPRYANERIVNGKRYFYYRNYRCTIDDWESGKPTWKLARRPRKTWQPNL